MTYNSAKVLILE